MKCIRCARSATPQYKTCEPCRTRDLAHKRRYVAAHRAAGECVQCGAPSKKSRCLRCYAMKREVRLRTGGPVAQIATCPRCQKDYVKTARARAGYCWPCRGERDAESARIRMNRNYHKKTADKQRFTHCQNPECAKPLTPGRRSHAKWCPLPAPCRYGKRNARRQRKRVELKPKAVRIILPQPIIPVPLPSLCPDGKWRVISESVAKAGLVDRPVG